jgi:hypothetical protein
MATVVAGRRRHAGGATNGGGGREDEQRQKQDEVVELYNLRHGWWVSLDQIKAQTILYLSNGV